MKDSLPKSSPSVISSLVCVDFLLSLCRLASPALPFQLVGNHDCGKPPVLFDTDPQAKQIETITQGKNSHFSDPYWVTRSPWTSQLSLGELVGSYARAGNRSSGVVGGGQGRGGWEVFRRNCAVNGVLVLKN